MKILPALLGEQAGAIGAALVARAGDRYRVDVADGEPALTVSELRSAGRGHPADVPSRRRRPRRGAAGPRNSASTACSSSTTCGPWARPGARHFRLPAARSAGRRDPAGPLRPAGGADRPGARRGPGRRARCRWTGWHRAGWSPGSGPATKERGRDHAYGIPFDPARQRRHGAARCAAVVLEAGVPVWVGGGAATVSSPWTRRRRRGQPVGGPTRGGGRAADALRGDVGRPGGRRGFPRSRTAHGWPTPGPRGRCAPGRSPIEAVAEAAAFVRCA